jgi:hypothetical protein
MSLDHVSVVDDVLPFTASTAFPLLLFSIVRPAGLIWFRMEVHDVADVDLELHAFLAPGQARDEEAVRMLVDSVRAINDEDMAINRRTAQGLRSRFAAPGRISRLEEGCRQFHEWWLARMAD